MNMLTTKEVAERLGVSLPRVHSFIKDGRLPAEKKGRDYFIKESDLKLLDNRKPGRPPIKRAATNVAKTGVKKGSKK